MRISDWSSDVCSSDLHEAINVDTFSFSRLAVVMELPRVVAEIPRPTVLLKDRFRGCLEIDDPDLTVDLIDTVQRCAQPRVLRMRCAFAQFLEVIAVAEGDTFPCKDRTSVG